MSVTVTFLCPFRSGAGRPYHEITMWNNNWVFLCSWGDIPELDFVVGKGMEDDTAYYLRTCILLCIILVVSTYIFVSYLLWVFHGFVLQIILFDVDLYCTWEWTGLDADFYMGVRAVNSLVYVYAGSKIHFNKMWRTCTSLALCGLIFLRRD